MASWAYEDWDLGEFTYEWNDAFPLEDWSLGEFERVLADILFEDWSLGEFTRSQAYISLDEWMLRSVARTQKCGSLLGVTRPLAVHSKKPYMIAGVTRDSGGDLLGNCIVRLIPVDGHGPVQETKSDDGGGYEFYVSDPDKEYLVDAYKSGDPNVFGSTERNLKGQTP